MRHGPLCIYIHIFSWKYDLAERIGENKRSLRGLNRTAVAIFHLEPPAMRQDHPKPERIRTAVHGLPKGSCFSLAGGLRTGLHCLPPYPQSRRSVRATFVLAVCQIKSNHATGWIFLHLSQVDGTH